MLKRIDEVSLKWWPDLFFSTGSYRLYWGQTLDHNTGINISPCQVEVLPSLKLLSTNVQIFPELVILGNFHLELINFHLIKHYLALFLINCDNFFEMYFMYMKFACTVQWNVYTFFQTLGHNYELLSWARSKWLLVALYFVWLVVSGSTQL